MLTTVLAALFVFGLLIIGHELGHFTLAKSVGVKVLEFSFGMGPKLVGFVKGETSYSIRAFPIGGFVKMLGEEGESTDPRAFCNQSPWRRLSIIIAGPLMNFILAVILFFVYSLNVGVSKPIVGQLEKGYPAEKAGVKVEDKIRYVNGQKIKTWEDFLNFVSTNKDNPFKLTVQRGDKNIDFVIKPVYDTKDSRYMIGIYNKVVKGSVVESLRDGVTKTVISIKQMVLFLGGAFKGKVTLNDVGGPVAIIKLSGEVARVGIWNLFAFAGFLSINLGIINLIPFPALDGGWVIILLLEAIRGKKIDDNKIGFINMIGFVILMLFAILVTYKDLFIK
jgi:regulator of sigma E protease